MSIYEWYKACLHHHAGKCVTFLEFVSWGHPVSTIYYKPPKTWADLDDLVFPSLNWGFLPVGGFKSKWGSATFFPTKESHIP